MNEHPTFEGHVARKQNIFMMDCLRVAYPFNLTFSVEFLVIQRQPLLLNLLRTQYPLSPIDINSPCILTLLPHKKCSITQKSLSDKTEDPAFLRILITYNLTCNQHSIFLHKVQGTMRISLFSVLIRGVLSQKLVIVSLAHLRIHFTSNKVYVDFMIFCNKLIS